MWKKTVIMACLLLITSLAYADTYYDNYSADMNSVQDKGNYPKITQIEKKLYSKAYENENIYQRLQRIEMSLYKRTYDTSDLATRVDNISDKTMISAMPGYLLNDIGALEDQNFNQIFKNETPDNRLERLEYHLIGAIQDGNYKDRIYKLKTLTDQNNISQYFDTNSNIYTGSSSSYASSSTSSRNRPTSTANKSKWETVENILFMVAPFLFCF